MNYPVDRMIESKHEHFGYDMKELVKTVIGDMEIYRSKYEDYTFEGAEIEMLNRDKKIIFAILRNYRNKVRFMIMARNHDEKYIVEIYHQLYFWDWNEQKIIWD